LGAVVGPALLNLARVRDERARGFAIGLTSHGIGTSRALAESPVTGGWSSAGMVLNALALTLGLPLVAYLGTGWPGDRGPGLTLARPRPPGTLARPVTLARPRPPGTLARPVTLARPRPSGTHTRPARTPAGLSRPAPSAHPAWEKCTEVSRCDVYGRSCLPESTFPTRPRAPPRPPHAPPLPPRPRRPAPPARPARPPRPPAVPPLPPARPARPHAPPVRTPARPARPACAPERPTRPPRAQAVLVRPSDDPSRARAARPRRRTGTVPVALPRPTMPPLPYSVSMPSAGTA